MWRGAALPSCRAVATATCRRSSIWNLGSDFQRVIVYRCTRSSRAVSATDRPADPRVESARFAIIIPGFGRYGVSEDASFHITTVLTFVDPVTEQDVRRMIQDACSAADGTIQLWFADIVHDGNTWAVTSAMLHPATSENPDLSALRGE